MRRSAAGLAVLTLLGCGSSNISPPVVLPSLAPLKAEVTIGATGFDPVVLHIFEGRAVKFINADAKPHSVFADPHPAHQSCGGLLNVTVPPGEERQITGLPIEACFFHDEESPSAPGFQGVLIVH